MMNQSEFLAINCNLPKVQEKAGVQSAIEFCFASHWLKIWCEIFRPITKYSNCNSIIAFKGLLKLF